MAVIGCAIALTCGLLGCAPAPADPGRPTYQLPPETVRPNEAPLQLPAVTEDDATFTLIGLTAGMPSVVGSHAEWPAKGQFVRIRVVVVNTGRSTLPFDSSRQQLITADGVAHSPDNEAMTIKRQPTKFELGANVRLEFDLYYDVPVEAKPVALRVFGGGTPFNRQDTGTDIPLG